MASAYFDYQSSTPLLPEVVEAMAPFWRDVFASSSALHQQGLRVRDALAEAREAAAGLIGAGSPEEIIFTSGGTESVNLAVQGVARAGHRRGRHLVTSPIEHPAVLRSIERLEKEGFTCTRVAVDRAGRIDPGAVKGALREDTCLVCLHHGNHDIGTLQPIRDIAAAVREQGVPLFVDATASGGWEPVAVRDMGISLLALAPHRFHGPKGVGILYRSRRVPIEAMIRGGMQEGELRAGTENVPGIVGAGVAARVAAERMEARHAHVARIQKAVWDGVQAAVMHVGLNGPEPGPGRMSTNLNLSVEFVEGEGLALMCDVRGIAVASGASCVSRALKGSPVLEAIGRDRSLAQANVILSFGERNAAAEVRYFLETFPRVVDKLRGLSPMWEDFRQGRVPSLLAAPSA